MFQDYIDEVKRTYSAKYVKLPEQLEHGIIGIGTESGELLDQLKRAKFYGTQLDKDNLLEELGDIMWYMALTMDGLGVSLNEVLAANIRKLRKRYSDKWTKEECLNRDTAAEIEALVDEYANIRDIHSDEEKQGMWFA